jgi:hypothetical protein
MLYDQNHENSNNSNSIAVMSRTHCRRGGQAADYGGGKVGPHVSPRPPSQPQHHIGGPIARHVLRGSSHLREVARSNNTKNAARVASEVRVVRVDRRDAQAQHCHKEMVFWLHRTTTRDRSIGTLVGGRTPAAAHVCTAWKRRSPMAPCRAAGVDQGGRCSAGGGSLAALCAPDLPPPLPPPPVGFLWREK